MERHSQMDHQRHAPEHHIASLGMYFGVFIALMILTVVTVAVSRVDLGALNTMVAMAVAVAAAWRVTELVTPVPRPIRVVTVAASASDT